MFGGRGTLTRLKEFSVRQCVFIRLHVGSMDEFVPCCSGFDWINFYQSGLLYRYRESKDFKIITEDMVEIVDLEACDVAGRC